jgi:putative spermidine/putrescine transport system substrate-binding protein
MPTPFHVSRQIASALVLLAAAGLAGPALAQGEPAKPDKIVVNASGGQMGESMRKSYVQAFTEKTGIQVVLTSPPDFGKLRAMVQAGNVEWTVTELSQDAYRAAEMGLLEAIDEKVVDRSKYPAQAKHKFLLTTSVYSTLLGYRKDKMPPGREPRSWADFWDVKTFPGPRSLRNSPLDTLEFALLADGVKPEKLYPIDLDRAFRSLDKIKPHIATWWTAGAQPPQLLADGEVVMTSGWNGRFYRAIQSGTPIGLSWQSGVMHQAYFGIPKGAPHAYWAQRFLAAMIDPKAQAVFANEFVSPGLNPDSLAFADPKVRAFLPTTPENLPRLFWSNIEWWTANMADVTRRWNRWILAK